MDTIKERRRDKIVFGQNLARSGNSYVQQHTVALENVHEIAHEENLQEENLEKQLGNALENSANTDSIHYP